ncbi:MAG: hypothetical protein JEZ11_03750 [Desulfobacterales bacterium]|nr:hypothetical protein [Desulfobacterales bacterium]
MTPEQAVLLMNIYMGSFSRFQDIFDDDIAFLAGDGLIDENDETTDLGNRTVQAMIDVAIPTPRPFYFTFGSGHEPVHGAGIRHYCLIMAENENSARLEINDWTGGKWAFCYHCEDVIIRHDLSRVKWNGERFVAA